MTRKPLEVALLVVAAMEDDNGCAFKPTEDQRERLVSGIARMMCAGCEFADADVQLLGAGEHTEMETSFKPFDGYDMAQQALCCIFDGLETLTREQAHTEICDLFAKNSGTYTPTADEVATIHEELRYVLQQVAPDRPPQLEPGATKPLICEQCGADRFTEACRRSFDPSCPMTGRGNSSSTTNPPQEKP